MTGRDAILARGTLNQLKRGVPPATGAAAIAVGFASHLRELGRLFEGERDHRWFAVMGDYGGGKSMFHALAREEALRAGYAVASLEVNRDEGALHEPQTHLPFVLRTLRSPLPRFADHLGIADIAHAWAEDADEQERTLALAAMEAVTPATAAPRDRGELLYLLNSIEREDLPLSARPGLTYRLVNYLTLRGISRGPTARFPAMFRLQVVIAWLQATGHRGLFLFADEVDNVLRQIHGKAHPGCFRTLAWYCSGPGLEGLKVVFAATPEVVDFIGPHGFRDLSRKVSDQKAAREEELAGFLRWARGLTQAEDWVMTCPVLTTEQRLRVFEKVTTVHRIAWGTVPPAPEGFTDLARMPQFRTTRRWVKACATLLDLGQQYRGLGLKEVGGLP
jgi:hypothetical protein